jgi:hypothetical protein
MKLKKMLKFFSQPIRIKSLGILTKEVKMPKFNPDAPININMEDLKYRKYDIITRERIR